MWLIDPEEGVIVSSYYGKRYAVHFTSDREARVREWQKARSTPPVGSKGERG